MTYPLFFGCLFVAFGIPATTFLSLVLPKSQLVIVSVSSSFFWLLALTASAVLWYILPWEDVYWFVIVLSVAFQEIARVVFFHFYTRAERSFSVVSTNAIAFPLRDHQSSIAAGLGFGLTYTGLLYGSLLANATGPGTLFSENCSSISIFVLSAWIALAFNILHVALMVICFDALRRPATLGSRLRLALVWVLHLAAALMTILNSVEDGCVYSIPLIWAVAVGACAIAYVVMSQPTSRSKGYTRVELTPIADLNSPAEDRVTLFPHQNPTPPHPRN